MNLGKFKTESTAKAKENKKYLQSLKKKDARKLDNAFHNLHEEVFEEVDCLTCANCCKTTSPIFKDRDIDRLAAHLKMKPGDFIEQYLHLDGENDYVLNVAPCPFLMDDNTCSVYEHRPRACREYPHTDRKKMAGILSLTYKNTMVCPAVLEIVERMKKGF
ncbi:YkgJ family cysteine cluster protein [Fulvivirga sp.]|uniref:YkgJ family cysteine cluster protein n=1 Tax=Fulvivirga sp. TaxID=1931237 RepID=UPI0032ED0171